MKKKVKIGKVTEARKVTKIIKSAKESIVEAGTITHRWDNYTLTVSGNDELIEKAFKDVKAFKEALKKSIDQINIAFPHGSNDGNMTFTLKIPVTNNKVNMEPIKSQFDFCVKECEH